MFKLILLKFLLDNFVTQASNGQIFDEAGEAPPIQAETLKRCAWSTHEPNFT